MRTEILAPHRWSDLERLFVPEVADDGCWCMSLRLAPGDEGYGEAGEPARRRLRALVLADAIHGALAYDGDLPVGWCSFEVRKDFRELDRSGALAVDDADRVWSIGCFYVAATHRGRGVPRLLLERALREIAAAGGRVVEAYPVKRDQPADVIADWRFTGASGLFERCGFTDASETRGCLRRVRLTLESPRP